jgi:hypothetical protein
MRALLLVLVPAVLSAAGISYSIDKITRYVEVSYSVPANAPERVSVSAEVRAEGASDWAPASAWPHASDTAIELMPPEDWNAGIREGRLTERRAAGLRRTLVWNPARLGSRKLTVEFRVRISDNGTKLSEEQARISLDNSDVILLNDWSKVVQQSAISENPTPGARAWWLRRTANGTALEVKEKGVELPALTYPLNLRGWYAMYVRTPAKLGTIELRLSGDERPESFSIAQGGREVFWRWADMTRQHLVIRQPYSTVYEYENNYRAHLDSVRLVPLSRVQVDALNERWSVRGDHRLLVGYYEPYSWAFYQKIESNQQHWEPLRAFSEAGLDYLDIQVGRGGSRMVFEGRVGSQLLTDTYGDPIRGMVPRTSNVGRMQQYTNTLATELRYARMLGLKVRANIGATNCYPGTPLEGEFSRQHPEWRKGSHLRYEVPEVRAYVLSLFEEALEIGAGSISLDWCRYPNALTSQETVTGFLRELRALADRYGQKRGKRIDILTRFPARGVIGWQYMDYATWAREGLVDYLAPSNIQGRHLNFDIGEYIAGVKGTRAKLLPCVDALGWGLSRPGMFLDRILNAYELGVPGIYVYQSDGPILEGPEPRRYLSLAASADSLRRWKERERAEQTRYSKDIYINQPAHVPQFHSWERVRIWVEGFVPGKVELWLDGKLTNSYDRPPYVLTNEDRASDTAIALGPHVLKARAFDGAGWVEREFKFEYAR